VECVWNLLGRDGIHRKAWMIPIRHHGWIVHVSKRHLDVQWFLPSEVGAFVVEPRFGKVKFKSSPTHSFEHAPRTSQHTPAPRIRHQMKSKQTEKVGIYRQLPPRDPHTKKTKVHIESQSNGSAHQLSNYLSEISTRFFYVAQNGFD
jgi:hypothetical protein